MGKSIWGMWVRIWSTPVNTAELMVF